ncbi:hypothetical protein N9I34_02595, partial [Gammaproteobacteria bacterium]|nr:hypothetical protein [Gammaproteobacteria bacterium]
MENRKSILKMFSIVVFGYALIAFSANISSQDEDISETNEAEVTEESEVNETDNGSSLKKCLMKAKSMKDKKKCQKEDMQSVEEFIDDEELELIEGYLKVYTDEDKSTYFLKLDEADLDKRFLYFAYIMNAPQGSTLMGGLPSDGKVLEFRKFKKDNIGLYQINTNYINGDEDNNIAR